MDLIPPLGVYAAMLREQGGALDYPGGAARVAQAVDVDLLARAIAWSGEAEAARNQAFNVTNGDVFTWENIWPAIADALDMKPGQSVPLSLAKEYPDWIAPWDELRRQHNLAAPDLETFVGLSFQYADYTMRYGQTQLGPPSIVSTVKINQAGFTEMMDTEAMSRNGSSRHGRRACCLSVAECRLHSLARLDRLVVGVERDVAPAHHGAMGDVVLQCEVMGEPNRQRGRGKACGGGHQFTPHGVAAFAVE